MIQANQADAPIETMCRVLGVSRSGYYAWRDRAPSERKQANEQLAERIRAIHKASDGTYGMPRIREELQAQGHRASRRRVARLMRSSQVRGVTRRRWSIPTTMRDRSHRAAPDLVQRKFEASAPNQLWVADATFVPTKAGFLYLATVLDVFSRKVVGWAMGEHLTTELVSAALDMALQTRRPEQVIHHSDQGSTYTSFAFTQRCKASGVAMSMGKTGDAYDNAMAESFFATLECELIDRRSWRTFDEARQAIFCWIEGWYNPRRRHSRLNYESPNEFERKRSSGQPMGLGIKPVTVRG